MKLKRGKKTGLKYFGIEDIRSWRPCYDPKRHLAEDWRGTAITILENNAIPFEDRLWVVLRTEIVSERTMRLFAVWCARQVQHLMTDPRSVAALDVAERFANGEATETELAAARDAARDAAWAAAWAAAMDAARAAARAAAWAAAWAAAMTAARDAAMTAARDAARDAAWAAAMDAQKTKLIEMIKVDARNEKLMRESKKASAQLQATL